MIDARKRDEVTLLTGESIVECARKWYWKNLRVLLFLLAGTVILTGCYYRFKYTTLGGFIQIAAVLIGVVAFYCLVPYLVNGLPSPYLKNYLLIRNNVPKNNYSLKRVKLIYRQERLSRWTEFVPTWYYDDNGTSNRLKTCFKVESGGKTVAETYPTFLDGNGACRITRRYGMETSSLRKISIDYHFLLFIGQEPCIIFPECDYRLSEDVAARLEKPD